MAMTNKLWEDPTIRGEIQYSMSKTLANALIQQEKMLRKKIGDPQQFLCDYVNREFGLKGYVTEVIIH